MQTYLEWIEKLSFQRYGGTAEEDRAADFLLQEIRALGGQGEKMPFWVDAPVPEEASVAVCAPWQETLESIPFGLSGSLPAGGVTLKLRYLERGDAMDFLGVGDLSDSVVLLNALTLDAYKRLVEHHAGAFLIMDGMYYDDMDSGSLYPKNLRPRFLEQGRIPGFQITSADATRLVQRQAQSLHVCLRQKERRNPSRNVLALIPGESEESIVLTAHYDSVPMGTGAWDNATGTAALMGIYRYFLAHPPKRTLRFIWCGAEEQGLLGSKAYIKEHEAQLASIKFCFNFDMCGTALGPNMIFVTGGDDLETFVRQFAKEQGYSAEITRRVHSSDSAPFADRGVPAVGLSRGTSTAKIHTRWDRIALLDERAMERNVAFAVRMIDRMSNAAVLPVETGMPEDMRKALDQYFQREPEQTEKNREGARGR